MRTFHDAAASFHPPAGARWQPDAAFPGGGEVICHNDLAPWKTVFVSGRPVAFIDWDLAAPGPRICDVAFALWHFVPLYGDAASDPFDPGTFEPRAHRTRLFCDVYGLSDRDNLIDTITRRQQATQTAIRFGAAAGHPAYTRLWELGAVAGIQRQVDYVREHRDELASALT